MTKLLPLLLVVAQGEPLGHEKWRFDVVHRTRGREPYRGLVVEETPEHVRVKCVTRKQGSPTVVLIARVRAANRRKRFIAGSMGGCGVAGRRGAVRAVS